MTFISISTDTIQQKDKTANEFRNVMDSRVVPDEKAATGQPLTHYHSMFFNILSV